MIQTNELRIGNWVRDTESDMNIKVAGLDPYEIFVGEINEEKEIYDCRDIEPIPLADELLEKCGFKDTGDNVFIHNLYFDIYKDKDGYYFIGYNKWDKQLRKAKLYNDYEWAKKIRDDIRFIERETFIVRVEIRELHDCNYED